MRDRDRQTDRNRECCIARTDEIEIALSTKRVRDQLKKKGQKEIERERETEIIAVERSLAVSL